MCRTSIKLHSVGISMAYPGNFSQLVGSEAEKKHLVYLPLKLVNQKDEGRHHYIKLDMRSKVTSSQ